MKVDIDVDKGKFDVSVDADDLWDADRTLAHVILPVLDRMSEVDHFCINVENDDVPEDLRHNDDEQYIIPSHLLDARYFYLMGEMKFAFSYVINPDKYKAAHQSGTTDLDLVETEDSTFEIVTGPNHTFVEDTDAIDALEKRCENGLKLFGKYFRGLWL